MKREGNLVTISRELIEMYILILWNQNYGGRSSGRQARIFIDQLIDDIGIRKKKLGRTVDYRNSWKEVVTSECLRVITV